MTRRNAKRKKKNQEKKEEKKKKKKKEEKKEDDQESEAEGKELEEEQQIEEETEESEGEGAEAKQDDENARCSEGKPHKKSRIRCPGKQGDLIVFIRFIGYQHYAVNVGLRNVIHLVGTKADATSGCLSCSSFTFDSANKDEIAVVKKEPYGNVFREGDKVRVEYDKTHLSKKKIIRRAHSKVGQTGYNLLFNNCEHFARWCRYGKSESKQIRALGFKVIVFIIIVVVVSIISLTIYSYFKTNVGPAKGDRQ